jgi:dTDP-4-dehydrorhamnose reductase
LNILLTGLNGTLAPHAARALQARGHQILAWHRSALDPELASAEAIDAHLDVRGVQGIVHLAMGSEHWAGAMARFAAQRGLPFVFTSTAMVFDASSGGPHRLGDERTARDDYGRYKIRCEDAVLTANPSAHVARIGYQIDWHTPSGNNMVAHLFQQAARGPIRASEAWIPATSCMPDTAQALADLLELARSGQGAGVHHLDSNAADAWAYPRIVAAIAKKLVVDWRIEVTRDYEHDQRLLAESAGAMPSISARLSAVGTAAEAQSQSVTDSFLQ